MSPSDIKQEVFCSWLCTHEYTVFAFPASVFRSPLACWLSDVTGHLYGVDGFVYGSALLDERYWKPLPCWAKMLVARLDACAVRPLSGSEVFIILASVEVALVHVGTRQQSVYA